MLNFLRREVTSPQISVEPESDKSGGEAVLLGQNTLLNFQHPVIHTLSLSPAIAWIENFLTSEECDHLIAISRYQLTQSLVISNEDFSSMEQTNIRSSSGTFLPMGCDYILKVIEARIASTTRIPLEYGEQMQVLNYQVGQEYKAHHDFFDANIPGSAKMLEVSGQRVVTMLLYLNDVPAGGETFFPMLNIKIPPRKGCALLFHNLHSNGIPDLNTLHASLPVLEGEKWLATKWIREKPFSNNSLPF